MELKCSIRQYSAYDYLKFLGGVFSKDLSLKTTFNLLIGFISALFFEFYMLLSGMYGCTVRRYGYRTIAREIDGDDFDYMVLFTVYITIALLPFALFNDYRFSGVIKLDDRAFTLDPGNQRFEVETLNGLYVIDSVRFEKIKGPTITGNFRLMFFDKETYYDHIIHVNSEKEYEDFCKLLRSWKILKPSFIIDFGRG
jgi:hypothetical protein